ncbi:MAG: hypothetical protein HKL96_09095 [Phycisphaerales bacterium]|nr:hypothetical protein [Phycisphaerales bacterium]
MFKSAARSLQRLSILLPIVLTSPAVLHAQRPADGNLFTHRFAPEHGLVSPSEEPFRTEICLNGLWRFEPLALPAGYKPGAGPPHLPNPTTNGWSQIPIRIPSPWNVDAFGKGNGYEFDTFPSYPQKWQDVKMGWLKTTFTVPANWKGRQIVLHFMSIVGAARIVVNGHRAADHFNNFLPFDVDVTPWVHIGGPNTLLVGVRKGTLMNIAGPYQSKYTYPTGSFWGMSMVGIDQDVYLLARPRLHIKSVFIQPLVNRNLLRAVVKVANRSGSPQTIALAAGIRPWHWRGKHNDITAPESKYSLGKTVVQMVAARGSVKAGQTKTFTLETKVNHALALWTLNHPHLYALVAELNVGGAAHDRLSTRFGWRQWTIHGRKLLLNGKPVQLMADAWHFLGVPAMTPRYAWAWFTMLKQAHCNAVRLHAQPRPPFFLQMADQMGIAVLDESGIWASHCHFNYWQPITWKRFARAIKAQVHRDRNHACVFGWSVANEIQAAMYAARVKPADKPMVTAKVVTLAHMVEAMDPTRPWVSSDGDGDMEGRLPVWVAHYGTPRGWQATYKHIHKPFAIGECTETYYSTPPMVAKIEGDRAYQSMRDYMQGLAVQGYDYALAERKFCAYGSLWDLVWYGLKPLPLGLANQSRPATLRDGIFLAPTNRISPACSRNGWGHTAARSTPVTIHGCRCTGRGHSGGRLSRRGPRAGLSHPVGAERRHSIHCPCRNHLPLKRSVSLATPIALCIKN